MPKLRTYRNIKVTTSASAYVTANIPKPARSLIAQLCSGSLKLRLETGRYIHEDLNDRICLVCDENAVENEKHFLFDCPAYQDLRNNLIGAYRLACANQQSL